MFTEVGLPHALGALDFFCERCGVFGCPVGGANEGLAGTECSTLANHFGFSFKCVEMSRGLWSSELASCLKFPSYRKWAFPLPRSLPSPGQGGSRWRSANTLWFAAKARGEVCGVHVC